MMDVLLKLEPVWFTIVGEMRDEMAGTPSTSGSHACCRAAFFLPPGQSTPRRSPALAKVFRGV